MWAGHILICLTDCNSCAYCVRSFLEAVLNKVYREEKKFLINIEDFLRTSHYLDGLLLQDEHNGTLPGTAPRGVLWHKVSLQGRVLQQEVSEGASLPEGDRPKGYGGGSGACGGLHREIRKHGRTGRERIRGNQRSRNRRIQNERISNGAQPTGAARLLLCVGDGGRLPTLQRPLDTPRGLWYNDGRVGDAACGVRIPSSLRGQPHLCIYV